MKRLNRREARNLWIVYFLIVIAWNALWAIADNPLWWGGAIIAAAGLVGNEIAYRRRQEGQ